jgi:hypothetical protein
VSLALYVCIEKTPRLNGELFKSRPFDNNCSFRAAKCTLQWKTDALHFAAISRQRASSYGCPLTYARVCVYTKGYICIQIYIQKAFTIFMLRRRRTRSDCVELITKATPALINYKCAGPSFCPRCVRINFQPPLAPFADLPT